MNGQRRERTHHGVRKYEVRAHFRRFPGKAQPHWIAYRTADGMFLVEKDVSLNKDVWADSPSQATVYLRRKLTKIYRDDIYDGGIVLLKVD